MPWQIFKVECLNFTSCISWKVHVRRGKKSRCCTDVENLEPGLEKAQGSNWRKWDTGRTVRDYLEMLRSATWRPLGRNCKALQKRLEAALRQHYFPNWVLHSCDRVPITAEKIRTDHQHHSEWAPLRASERTGPQPWYEEKPRLVALVGFFLQVRSQSTFVNCSQFDDICPSLREETWKSVVDVTHHGHLTEPFQENLIENFINDKHLFNHYHIYICKWVSSKSNLGEVGQEGYEGPCSATKAIKTKKYGFYFSAKCLQFITLI